MERVGRAVLPTCPFKGPHPPAVVCQLALQQQLSQAYKKKIGIHYKATVHYILSCLETEVHIECCMCTVLSTHTVSFHADL